VRGEKTWAVCEEKSILPSLLFGGCKKDIEISECSYYTDAIKN